MTRPGPDQGTPVTGQILRFAQDDVEGRPVTYRCEPGGAASQRGPSKFAHSEVLPALLYDCADFAEARLPGSFPRLCRRAVSPTGRAAAGRLDARFRFFSFAARRTAATRRL
jgi:hypothetical protein